MAATVPLFDQFAIIALSSPPGEAPRPTVHVSIHPSGAVAFASSIEAFCFPDAELPQSPNAGAESDFYVFVLTNADRERQLGFCRRIFPRVGAPAPRQPITLCFLSRHFWFTLWANLLQAIENVYQARGIDGILDVVDELQLLPLPLPNGALLSEPIGASSALQGIQKMSPKLMRPQHGDPPLGDLDARPLFQSLSVAGVVQVMCNLLSERRVIFVSSSIARLSACVHAAAALLYPFAWQHVFVPVVPHSLLSYCCAPMPFIVGVLTPYLDEVKQMPLEEVSIINLDSDIVEVSLEDISMLPSELVAPLHNRLDRIVANWKRTPPDCAIPVAHVTGTGIWEARELMRAFLSFFVGIFGTYRRFFSQQPDGSAKFDREGFCSAQGPRIQKFLEAFSQVQMFEVFLHEREKQGNQNAPPQTEFERQAYLHDVTTRGPSTKEKLVETTRTAVSNTRNAAKQLFGGLFVKGDDSSSGPSSQPPTISHSTSASALHSTAPPAAAGHTMQQPTMKSYGTLSTPSKRAAASTVSQPARTAALPPSAASSSSSSTSQYVPPHVPLYSSSSTPNLYSNSTLSSSPSPPPQLPARPASPQQQLQAKPTTPPLPAPPASHVPGPAVLIAGVPPPVPPRPARSRAPSDLIEFAGAPASSSTYQPHISPVPLISAPPAQQPPPFASEFRSATQVDAFSPRRDVPSLLPPRPSYGITEADLFADAPPAALAVHQVSAAQPPPNFDPFALFASPPTEEAKLSSLPYETL